jgi:hypothetical protein
MDKEYVQENSLTGVSSRQLEAPHGRLQPFTLDACPTRLRRAPRSAQAWSALRMVGVKLVAPTSQAAALFYGWLFEIAPAIKLLLRGDMTEQGSKLNGDAGRCGQ